MVRGAHRQDKPDLWSESRPCCRHRHDACDTAFLCLRYARLQFPKIVLSIPQDRGTDTLCFHTDTPTLSDTNWPMVQKSPETADAPSTRSSTTHNSLLGSSLWSSNESTKEDDINHCLLLIDKARAVGQDLCMSRCDERLLVYYESIKRERKRRLIYACKIESRNWGVCIQILIIDCLLSHLWSISWLVYLLYSRVEKYSHRCCKESGEWFCQMLVTCFTGIQMRERLFDVLTFSMLKEVSDLCNVYI